MASAFIVKELRGARALRLFYGRSAFPPPIECPALSEQERKASRNGGFFVDFKDEKAY
jgi:hypothetical protein